MIPDQSLQKIEKPRFWFYIIVPLASVILTTGLIEMGLTLFYPIPFAAEVNMYYEEDLYLGYRIKPNSTGFYQNDIPANGNVHGHRDDVVSISKPDGVYRILVLGDSFTIGASVRQEEAYPQLLEQMLNERMDIPVELINTAVGGYAPFQYAQYYEYYGQAFEPDMVLVGLFVGNDTYQQIDEVSETRTAVLGRRVDRANLDTNEQKVTTQVFLYQRFHLARLIFGGDGQRGSRVYTRDHCADFTDSYLEIQRRRINNQKERNMNLQNRAQVSLNQIGRIQTLANDANIPLLVILIPDENQVNPHLEEIVMVDLDLLQYDLDMPQSMLQDLFAIEEIQTLDLLSTFRSEGACMYMNDTHWSPEGHQLAASSIVDALIASMERDGHLAQK